MKISSKFLKNGVSNIKIDINNIQTEKSTNLKAPVGASFAKHKIIVMSGKGGVGKSTVAVNLATALVENRNRVGIIDFDLTGPSIPKLLGIEHAEPEINPKNKKLIPIEVKQGLLAISLAYFVKKDSAVIWRSSMKVKAIKNFLSQVEWGSLDYLIMDLPPGTSDEPLTVAQQIPDPTGAIIVTTPQDVATSDVRKSIIFAQKLNVPILGVIENMSSFVCPHCGNTTNIFKRLGGRRLADDMNVNFLGSIPLDPLITEGGDDGKPFVLQKEINITKSFHEIVRKLVEIIN